MATTSAPSSASPSTDRPAADSGTVNRTLRILSAFAAKDRWALNDLARALNLPRATAHRLLNLCKPLGYVEQDADGLYRPGIEYYRVAGRIGTDMPINRLADPLLQAIRDETDETTMLVLLARQDLKMFFSHWASPAHPLRYALERNRLASLAWGAAGRSLLAYLDPAEIDTVIAREEASPLDGRPLDAAELRAALETIRRDGHACSYAQRAPDMHGLAVPFFDSDGQVRGNVMLTVPHFRFDPSRQDRWLALLRDAATELTRRLGWA
ncbi:IclR family transcriptional regulator [uncultured Xylophilus sp.]|uniref:IclR family transcriptional regulator n=1 Tax=uncultured Xylophilus sp. TaxID=296832 RepID=UPI0025E16D50|nr:IclR family transcriptional regulator [uncultured Xylophilus sp.]